jgi:uncharacterized protein
MIQSMWHILLELAPWLLIGVAVAGALHALLPPDFMRRHLTGRWSVFKAAAIGVPLPLCSCAVIPVGLSLKRQGASSGASVAFLISTPQTGIDSIAVSGALLGLPFALFKTVSAFVIGVVGGLLTDALATSADGKTPPPAVCEARTGSRWRAFLDHSLSLLRAIWRWLVVGVVASAAITYLLPPNSLAGLGAQGGLWAMVLAVLFGMPLYVCAVASVPVAAALVHSGFPPGAALVFLIAGPASNIATMGAIYRSLGRRAFAIYMITIAVGSIAFGWAFQPILELGTLHGISHNEHEGHAVESWWAVASAIALLAIMAWFAFDDVRTALRKRRPSQPVGPLSTLAEAEPSAPSVEVGVEGMTCQNCVARLEKTLTREEGVAAVAITLDPGRAVVRGSITLSRVRELIERAGFQPVS